MSNIFDNIKKYDLQKWETVGEPAKLDSEDLTILEPTALIVKSTWGKSVKFTTRVNKYCMFIPCDPSVDYPVGTEVPLTAIRVITLHREGSGDIQRIRIEAFTRFSL